MSIWRCSSFHGWRIVFQSSRSKPYLSCLWGSFSPLKAQYAQSRSASNRYLLKYSHHKLSFAVPNSPIQTGAAVSPFSMNPHRLSRSVLNEAYNPVFSRTSSRSIKTLQTPIAKATWCLRATVLGRRRSRPTSPDCTCVSTESRVVQLEQRQEHKACQSKALTTEVHASPVRVAMRYGAKRKMTEPMKEFGLHDCCMTSLLTIAANKKAVQLPAAPVKNHSSLVLWNSLACGTHIKVTRVTIASNTRYGRRYPNASCVNRSKLHQLYSCTVYTSRPFSAGSVR
mmetsp:Transcript_44992/g.104121  ORF Transcript_44992/g.104121 Transcript_44992/m.104121 type:complete len:283 (+) Transcript_44992:171-1019(+)